MLKFAQISCAWKMKNVTEVKVYYADTDHGGVVYYANYLKWFEIGRTEFIKQAGFTYADFEKQNLIAPVVEVKCNYLAPARYNDTIVIETTVEKVGNSSITFLYIILNKKSNEKIAEGYTVNVFVDMTTQKSAPIPEKLKQALK